MPKTWYVCADTACPTDARSSANSTSVQHAAASFLGAASDERLWRMSASTTTFRDEPVPA